VPIEQISLPSGAPVAGLWRDAALRSQAWLAGQGLSPRDAVMLVPYAALMVPARAAWAALGGWQPRVETPLTLAGTLGPPVAMTPGQCSGDGTLDALSAGLLLRGLPWGADWAARDPAGFAHIVGSVVDAAQALRAAALQRAPSGRDDFWAAVRETLPAAAGPAATEALLLRVAVEWAAAACATGAAASDRLFDHRPSAWLVLRLGGPEPMAEALLGHAQTPSLLLLADPPDDDPYSEVAARAQVERLLCDDFETEAQATAATVIEALNAGRTPVALVALDRESVRRVRALLARAAVPLIDETGWLLATTRAAAAVVAVLRAALPSAGPDDHLDWLKTWPLAPPAALNALEAMWRDRPGVQGRDAAERLWSAAQAHLQPLQAERQRTLADWLGVLRTQLEACGSYERWLEDDAGAQVLAALGWTAGAAWLPAAQQLRLDLPGFIAWVQSTLEQQPFLPLPDPGAQVVLTPLARAFGRPFEQVVIPGADHVHLGSSEPQPTLISDALAQTLGLDHGASRRAQRRLALAQVLRAPRVTLLRRRRDGDEPLADSPDVEWLLLARGRVAPPDAPAWSASDWQAALREVPRLAVARPLPTAASALPSTLSASRLEALRDCPYCFYSRAVLRLDEAEEIEAGLAKRDYGTWLHAVLHHFHSQRLSDAHDPDDLQQLQQAADAVTLSLGLSPSELLPFRASFETFAPAYVTWLAGREAQGWLWHSGETDHVLDLPGLPTLQLKGRIDRIDLGPAQASQVLDYKTSSSAMLKERVRDPLEDTQLAFYAALLGAPDSLEAAYLALDDAQAPLLIEHPAVHESAVALLDGLSGEWQRLQQGAALPAMGEGRVCETCEARGLCRRDHWGAA
jgi:ATP-dependent helicase/nuclease subunit B